TSTGEIDLSRIACAIAVALMSAISLTELLLDHPASAVDQKALTGDEPRLIAGKKGHRSRDIFRLANKPYRRIGLDPINDFGGHGVMSAGSNCTGRNGIDGHTKRGEFTRQCPREAHEPHLGRCVVYQPGIA